MSEMKLPDEAVADSPEITREMDRLGQLELDAMSTLTACARPSRRWLSNAAERQEPRRADG